MHKAAASDPIAAAFIGSGAIVSATIGRLFGFTQDPDRAAAGGAIVSGVVSTVGGAGLGRATKKPADRTLRGNSKSRGSPTATRRTPAAEATPKPAAQIGQASGALGIDTSKIISDPKTLWGRSTKDIAEAFRASGYQVTVRQSTKGSMRAEIIEIKGHKEISQIQVHPGGGRHGGAYVKISTSAHGRIKVVDSSTYKPTPDEKAKIIPNN